MVRSQDSKLWKAIEKELESERNEQHFIFPKSFLLSLRAALESGFTCDQITVMIMIMTGMEEMRGRFDKETFIDRVSKIVQSMTQVE